MPIVWKLYGEFMRGKKKKSLVLVFAIVVLLVLIFFGALYYITSTVNNYSYTEKRWINDNSSRAIDLYV